MKKLTNVVKMRYEINNDKLFVTHDGDPSGNDSYETKNGGQKFQMIKEGTTWTLVLEEDTVVTGIYTEIQTTKTGSDLDFDLFFPGTNRPRMAYIGIQDIRDGFRPRWEIAFKDSFMSIETNGGQLTIRKAHH